MDNTLVGRRKEKEELLNLFYSGRSEFITIYGRRRVGKTFLVNSLFGNDFAFKITAVLEENTQGQLRNFAAALSEYGNDAITPLTDWFDAFEKLRVLLEHSRKRRKIVFFDEMPWFDTKSSKFIPALEHFWNGWASAKSDVILIACGSATSWIVKKLLKNRGGLHNRITRRILLQPFTLAECRLYAQREGLPTDEQSLLEIYMIFGGIPYYLSLIDRNLSLTQNVNRLCFTPGGELRDEFNNLYASLFNNATNHILVVEALGKKKSGLTRDDIKNITKLPEGGSLFESLEELELCGFIRKFAPFARKKKGMIYQLVDHFTLFYLAFVKGSSDDDPDYWMKKRETQSFRTWRGYAFEQVCLSHINQIKNAIGVAGVITHVESWRSEHTDPGVQIDLMINRNDQVVSLCEMKFSDTAFSFTKKQALELRTKRSVFIEETGTRKAVHIALITPFGIKRSDYSDIVQSIVTAEDLFKG